MPKPMILPLEATLPAGDKRLIHAGAFTFIRLLALTAGAQVEARFTRGGEFAPITVGEALRVEAGADAFDVIEVRNVGGVEAAMRWKVTQNVITTDDRLIVSGDGSSLVAVSPSVSYEGAQEWSQNTPAAGTETIIAEGDNVNGVDLLYVRISTAHAQENGGVIRTVLGAATVVVLDGNGTTHQWIDTPRYLPPGVGLEAAWGTGRFVAYVAYRLR